MFRNKFFAFFMLLAALISGTQVTPTLAAKREPLPYLKPITAKIQSFDNFGNGILSVTVEDFLSAGYRAGDVFMVEIPNVDSFYVPFVNSVQENGIYGFSLVGEPSSSHHLALAITNMNFANIFKAHLGAPIKITRARYQAHTPDMSVLAEAMRLNSSNGDANFREVTTGIKPGLIYRSSSPIDFKSNPSMYQVADRKASEAHIATIINLCNSEEETKSLAKQSNNKATYYKKLLASGQVFSAQTLHFHYDKTDTQSLARAFRFMLSHNGPYLIHDKKGIDQAGFFCLLLEGLAGASKTQVTEDYMKSFVDMLHISRGSEDYNTIKQYTVARLLIALSAPSIMSAPQNVDWGSGTGSNVPLEQAVRAYLRDYVGLSEQEINLLHSRIASQGTKTKAKPATKTKTNTMTNHELKEAIKQKTKDSLNAFKEWWKK